MINAICDVYWHQTLQSSSDCPEDPASCGCSQWPGILKPNPDVGGIGVLIGFVGTAWLVVLLAVLRYVLAYNPKVNPFDDEDENFHGQQRNEEHQWTPNPVDSKTIGWLSTISKRIDREIWENAMEKIFLSMGDIQMLTGFGILLSGVIQLRTYISAYHWQTIVHLAWFSNLTHAACLTALRRYLYKNQAQRNWRLVLMTFLLAALIISILPTAYFNWPDDYFEGSAAMPSSNARCFFDGKMIPKLWCPPRHCLPSSSYSDCLQLRHFKYAKATTAYESHIFSILILVVTFTTRAVKVTKTLSYGTRTYVQWSVRRSYLLLLKKANKGYQQLPSRSITKRLWSMFRPLDLLMGSYLTAKLYSDLISSELFDVYWLLVSATWGSIRLLARLNNYPGLVDEAQWTFGQILPVFLLAGPITSVALSIPITPPNLNDRLGKLPKWLRGRLLGHRPNDNQHEISLNEHWSAPQVPSVNLSQQHPAPASRDESASDADASVQGHDQSYNPSNMEVNNELTAPGSGSSNSQGFRPFNQDLIKEEDDADTIKTHLLDYYLHSRWMSFCFGFVWLQLISVTIFSIVFLSLTRPSPFLVLVAFIVLLVQPVELFSVITLGLYVTDRQKSKVFLFSIIIIQFLLLLLTIFVMISKTVFEVASEFKLLALAPLMLLVGLSFYLNRVK